MSIKMPFAPPLPSAASSVGLWPKVTGNARGNEKLFNIASQFSDFKTAETVLKMEDTLRGTDDKTRNRVIHRLMVQTAKDKRTQLDGLNSSIADLKLEREILQELAPWWTGDLVLQRPNGSCFHRLIDACLEKRLILMLGTSKESGIQRGSVTPPVGESLTGRQSFVVEHDWASAFKGATDFDGGEVHLPYEKMVFEFVISGKRVVVLTSSDYDIARISPFIETKCAGWVIPQFIYERTDSGIEPSRTSGNVELDNMRDLLIRQIRAICISLEAEAATTEIVRAPHKLNRAREKMGRTKLVDYHVVRLAHRSRPSTLPEANDGEKRTSPRLHFRRGHWRHFGEHKTWIKWMLVGDPDLGFIDKHYRL